MIEISWQFPLGISIGIIEMGLIWLHHEKKKKKNEKNNKT